MWGSIILPLKTLGNFLEHCSFAFVLAFFAHYMVGDGEQMGALVATILLLTSYFTNKKIQ